MTKNICHVNTPNICQIKTPRKPSCFQKKKPSPNAHLNPTNLNCTIFILPKCAFQSHLREIFKRPQRQFTSKKLLIVPSRHFAPFCRVVRSYEKPKFAIQERNVARWETALKSVREIEFHSKRRKVERAKAFHLYEHSPNIATLPQKSKVGANVEERRWGNGGRRTERETDGENKLDSCRLFLWPLISHGHRDSILAIALKALWLFALIWFDSRM